MKLPSLRTWLRGMIGASIGGAANAVTLMVIKPEDFNFTTGWTDLWHFALISAVVSAALYLKEHPLPDEDKVAEPLQKLPLPLIAFLVIAGSLGCTALAPNYSALPANATAEQKQGAALADIKKNASDSKVQAAARFLLTQTGKQAIQSLADEPDRQAVKDQLVAWGGTVTSLLETGQSVTPEQLKGIFSTFESRLDSEKFARQFGDVTSIIHDYLAELRAVDDVEILRQWALVFAKSAIAAGS